MHFFSGLSITLSLSLFLSVFCVVFNLGQKVSEIGDFVTAVRLEHSVASLF